MIAIQNIPIAAWASFHLIIGALLVIDLGYAQRKPHAPSLREALGWSVLWIMTAVVFDLLIYLSFGPGQGPGLALDFGTAYLTEKSLSVDNLVVFAVIFRYFRVEMAHQHKILFWGIIGAILTRATFIVAGIGLLDTFSWMVYIFGALLFYAAFRLLRGGEAMGDPSRNLLVRLLKRFVPFDLNPARGQFFVKVDGKRLATALFLTLLAIESTDIVFAFDSVPAVLAITRNLFIAYTSNIFAVLGLRALYFVVIRALLNLRYLNGGVAILLGFLAFKFLVSASIDIPNIISLLVVSTVLGMTIIASLLMPRKQANATQARLP